MDLEEIRWSGTNWISQVQDSWGQCKEYLASIKCVDFDLLRNYQFLKDSPALRGVSRI
jgi:hypothetical protein